MGAHFDVEAVAVHAEVARGIPESDDPRQDLANPMLALIRHGGGSGMSIVTTGDLPSLRSTFTSPAPSSHIKARYLAFRSQPKRWPDKLLSGMMAERVRPAAYQSAMPAWRLLPGSRAAVSSHTRGIGPFTKPSPFT